LEWLEARAELDMWAFVLGGTKVLERFETMQVSEIPIDSVIILDDDLWHIYLRSGDYCYASNCYGDQRSIALDAEVQLFRSAHIIVGEWMQMRRRELHRDREAQEEQMAASALGMINARANIGYNSGHQHDSLDVLDKKGEQ
jgi:hypothetical protein